MRKRLFFGAVLLFLLVSVLFLVNVLTETEGEYTLYFSNAERTELVAEQRDIEFETEEELLNRAIEGLLLGPQPSSELVSVIPKGTQLKSLTFERNCVALDFSSQFLNSDNYVDSLLARYSVVKTVCDLSDSFSSVRLTVEGEPISDNYGNELGLMSSDDTLFDAVSLEQKKVKAILYFADFNGEKLIAEERVVSVSEAETIAEVVLQELLEGPENSTSVATIPVGTKVLSVEVKNGVCYADFSKDFVEQHIGGSSAEILTVYSVVYTLTAIEEIDQVQFLIDGKIRDVFGNMLFSEPFTSNIR